MYEDRKGLDTKETLQRIESELGMRKRLAALKTATSPIAQKRTMEVEADLSCFDYYPNACNCDSSVVSSQGHLV